MKFRRRSQDGNKIATLMAFHGLKSFEVFVPVNGLKGKMDFIIDDLNFWSALKDDALLVEVIKRYCKSDIKLYWNLLLGFIFGKSGVTLILTAGPKGLVRKVKDVNSVLIVGGPGRGKAYMSYHFKDPQK